MFKFDYNYFVIAPRVTTEHVEKLKEDEYLCKAMNGPRERS